MRGGPEKLIDTCSEMDIEPTNLNLSENDSFDDFLEDFEDNPVDDNMINDDMHDDEPDFTLKHDTTDEQIMGANYADLLYQIRLREKKYHKFDRSQLEDLNIERFLREVKKCRDRIANKYKALEEAYNTFHPSLYETMDNESIKHEYSVYKKKNNNAPTFDIVDDMRSYLSHNHPAWDSVHKRMTTLSEITNPPIKAITYYRYDKREIELQAYRIYLLNDVDIITIPHEKHRNYIVTACIYANEAYNDEEMKLMTIPDLQQKLKKRLPKTEKPAVIKNNSLLFLMNRSISSTNANSLI